MFFCNHDASLLQQNRRRLDAGSAGLTLQLTVAHQDPIEREKARVNHQNTGFVVNLQISVVIIALLVHVVEQSANWLRNHLHLSNIDRAFLRDLVLANELLLKQLSARFILVLRHGQSSYEHINFRHLRKEQSCMKKRLVGFGLGIVSVQ